MTALLVAWGGLVLFCVFYAALRWLHGPLVNILASVLAMLGALLLLAAVVAGVVELVGGGPLMIPLFVLGSVALALAWGLTE